jgi:transcriptional regulator with XRE-family HTH domain
MHTARMAERSRLIEARKALGLTQEQLSAKTGIGQSTISRIEGGTLMPSATIARKLIEALDVTLEDFCDDTDAATLKPTGSEG